MSVSKLGMAKKALIRLGASPIVTLTDTSKNAVTCNTLLAGVIDYVLCEYPWKCVECRSALSQIGPPSFGYDFQYELPNDPWCLVPRKLYIGDVETMLPWKVEERYLLTNQDNKEEEVSLIYTQRPPIMKDLSTWVEGLIVLRLAFEACFAITQSSNLKTEIWNEYQDALMKAKMRDGGINYVEGEDGNTAWETAGR